MKRNGKLLSKLAGLVLLSSLLGLNCAFTSVRSAYWQHHTNNDPTNPEYHYRLADSYLKNKLYNKAIVEFRKATEIQVVFAEAWAGMGVALANTGEQAAADKALEFARMANPTLEAYKEEAVQFYCGLGDICLDAGCLPGAWKHIKKAMSWDSEQGKKQLTRLYSIIGERLERSEHQAMSDLLYPKVLTVGKNGGSNSYVESSNNPAIN